MGPIKMKKEYGFPFRGGWVKAKKKPIDGFPKKKERELSNWNKIIGVTYFFLSKKTSKPLFGVFGHVLSEVP